MNRLGQTIVPAVYDHAYPFRNGLAAVRKGNLWGAIDLHGEPGAPHLDFEIWVHSRGGANRVSPTCQPPPTLKTPATQTNKTTNPAPASCRLITPHLLHLKYQTKTPKLPETRELFLCNQYFAGINPFFSILFTPSRKEVLA